MSKTTKIFAIVTLCAVLLTAAVLAGYFGFIAANPLNAPDLSEGGVRYIAHRGLSSEHYENTEAAFRAAAESSFFFGIETDIYRTADGKYVCAHDNAAFADGNLKISELTLEECLALPLAFSDEYGMSGEDERLCTFETFLSVCRDGGKTAVIEFKPDFTKEETAEILDTARSYLPTERILVISFSASNIRILSDMADGIGFMYLGTNRVSAEFFARRGCPVGLNADKANKSFAKKIRNLGVSLNVWNVKSKEQADKLASFGANFLTTDFDFSAQRG